MALASLLGVTSDTRGSTVLWLNLFLNSRNKFDQNYWKKKKKGTGLERLKINLSWSLQLQPWNRRELCEIWVRISWFLDLSLWHPLRLALRRRGMGLWVCADFGWGRPWILCFLAFFCHPTRRRGVWSTWQQHWTPCEVAPAALVSAVVWFVWVSPLVAWPVWQ